MRPLLPKPGSAASSSGLSEPPPKRAKAIVACEGCRRRKIKCDTRRPTCSQCARSKLECEYMAPEGMSTRDARREQIENLSLTNRDLRTVLELLRSVSPSASLDVIRRIREAPTLDSAVSLIADASLLLPGYAGPPAYAGDHSIAPSNIDSALGDEVAVAAARIPLDLPISRWTSVSSDNKFLAHLLDLFWTWDYLAVQLVDKAAFLDGLHAEPADEEILAGSRFLVNSLLALSTVHLRRPDPIDSHIDVRSIGRQFATEAYGVLEGGESRPSLHLLQGAAFLWLFESTGGDSTRVARISAFFFHLYPRAMHLPPPRMADGSPAEPPPIDWLTNPTLAWGFYFLDAKIATTLRRKTIATRPSVPPSDIPGMAELSDIVSGPPPDEPYWNPYPISTRAQRSYSRAIFAVERTLAILTEDILEIMDARTAPGDGGDAEDDNLLFRTTYSRLLEWKTGLPHQFYSNGTSLPSITFLMTSYDFLLLKFLQVFPAECAQVSDGRDLVASCAVSIISNLWVYSVAYGPRHEYWLGQACFAAAMALVPRLEGGFFDLDNFVRANQLLYEIADYLPAARGFLLTIRRHLTAGYIQTTDGLSHLFENLMLQTGPDGMEATDGTDGVDGDEGERDERDGE